MGYQYGCDAYLGFQLKYRDWVKFASLVIEEEKIKIKAMGKTKAKELQKTQHYYLEDTNLNAEDSLSEDGDLIIQILNENSDVSFECFPMLGVASEHVCEDAYVIGFGVKVIDAGNQSELSILPCNDFNKVLLNKTIRNSLSKIGEKYKLGSFGLCLNTYVCE